MKDLNPEVSSDGSKSKTRKLPSFPIGIVLNAVMGGVSYKILLPAFIHLILNVAMGAGSTDIFLQTLKGFAPVFLAAIAINAIAFFIMRKHINKKVLYWVLTSLIYIVFLIGTFLFFEIKGY